VVGRSYIQCGPFSFLSLLEELESAIAQFKQAHIGSIFLDGSIIREKALQIAVCFGTEKPYKFRWSDQQI
jgi:hypothetical protein